CPALISESSEKPNAGLLNAYEWATICYQAGLSLEEAEKTYLHLDADDTILIAEKSAKLGASFKLAV
ncbi:hypothetical protein WDW86_00150, partial [Bdellovibrionota bacterium FG-2]